jgi:hypothetical protein
VKTYTILYAEDVPCYGTARIKARNEAAALDAARDYDLSEVAIYPDWRNGVCKRIIHIEGPRGKVFGTDIPLDNCFLRYGGEKDRLLCEAARDLLDAVELCEEVLSDLSRLDDGTPSVSALNMARDAIAKAKGSRR